MKYYSQRSFVFAILLLSICSGCKVFDDLGAAIRNYLESLRLQTQESVSVTGLGNPVTSSDEAINFFVAGKHSGSDLYTHATLRPDPENSTEELLDLANRMMTFMGVVLYPSSDCSGTGTRRAISDIPAQFTDSDEHKIFFAIPVNPIATYYLENNVDHTISFRPIVRFNHEVVSLSPDVNVDIRGNSCIRVTGSY